MESFLAQFGADAWPPGSTAEQMKTLFESLPSKGEALALAQLGNLLASLRKAHQVRFLTAFEDIDTSLLPHLNNHWMGDA